MNIYINFHQWFTKS